jgi:ATP-dependent Lon protease
MEHGARARRARRQGQPVFAGKVVRKDLVRKVKVGANVPVFVLEFLLGKYCASSDEMAIQMGCRSSTTRSPTTTSARRVDEGAEQGQGPRPHTFIDKVKVRLVDSDYWAEVTNFGHKNVHVPEHYVRDFERLLMGGIWAQVDMRFEYDEESKGKNPFWIDKLTPIQIATFDLEEYRRCAPSSRPTSGSTSSAQHGLRADRDGRGG